MKLTFLGTGAAEGYPGYWCRCPHCSYARERGGRNLRANSCAVIDGELMLDMGPASFDSAARLGIDLSQVSTLLLTHPHEDHLYPMILHWRKTREEMLSLPFEELRSKGGPRFTPIPDLDIFGNTWVMQLLGEFLRQEESQRIRLHTVTEGQSFESGGFTVTPIRGNHGDKPGFAHSYVLQKGGKTLLYALDTGIYEEDQLALLRGFVFDLVIMEGTTGLNEQYGGHMCLESNKKMKRWLEEQGCLRPASRFYLTHLSPHWCPPYDRYAPMVEAEGMILAYDGMEIEL